MKLLVARAGYLTSVQDLGRTRHRSDGVSVGGALDVHALRVANLLVGNEPAAAGLELALGETRLRFTDARVVAWCGGDFTVRAGTSDVPAGRAAFVAADEELSLKPSARGARVWLAVSSGIEVPLLLGSASTDLRSRFGGFDGRPLRDGDALALGRMRDRSAAIANTLISQRVSDWSAPTAWSRTRAARPVLRLIRGADASHFADAAFTSLVAAPFTVTAESDRMGVRLRGPELRRLSRDELLSEAVAPGTVQVPPSGDPIVLLGDCQTIGGYPKIAHVITVDLPAVAQLMPGDVVHFAEVPLSHAHSLLFERERDLAWFRAGVALKNK